MAKAPKRSTPTDDELRDELRYWPEWMGFSEAQRHVEDIVRGDKTAAEALRRRIISGDIEIQSDIGNLKPEDFRAATCDMFGRLSLEVDIHDYGVRLRRADVYQFWPTRWMGAEGKARLEPTAAPVARKPRSVPTTKRRVQAERQKDKLERPATELTHRQTPQLPALLATRPRASPT